MRHAPRDWSRESYEVIIFYELRIIVFILPVKARPLTEPFGAHIIERYVSFGISGRSPSESSIFFSCHAATSSSLVSAKGLKRTRAASHQIGHTNCILSTTCIPVSQCARGINQ